MPAAEQLEFCLPALITPGPQPGSFIVRPGKPIIQGDDVSVRAACRILRASEDTVYRHIKAGRLEVRQTHRRARYRIKRESLARLATR